MALVAGRSIVTMADSTVGRPELSGMLLVQRPAGSVLEPGMTCGTISERFTQRTAGETGAVTFSTVYVLVLDMKIMTWSPRSGAEIVSFHTKIGRHDVMTEVTCRRRLAAMADITTGVTKVGYVFCMQSRDKPAPLKTCVAVDTVGEYTRRRRKLRLRLPR